MLPADFVSASSRRVEVSFGVGIGLGVSRRRPTKANPLQFCTIGSILTSVEVGPEPPFEVVLKPDCNVSVNGIDFIYTESNRCLSCIIRFSKVVVSDEAVATSRLAAAEVVANKVSGVYIHLGHIKTMLPLSLVYE